MSFKCSVFGHAYGDSEIERNREEDGSEVVTTIKEKQTCKRCGESRIVSENKEVTTLETAADIVADDLEEEETETAAEDVEEPAKPSPESPQPAAEPAEPATEESEEPPIPDAETGEVVTAGPEETAPPESTTPPEETVDPETDDGVILEEEKEPEQPEREPGEWPQETTEPEDDWEPETEVDPVLEETTVEPTGSAVTVPDGEFHCPECEFTTPVEESSLRAGDFCPECHRGSLEHVTE